MSNQALALAEKELPAHLKQIEGMGRGNEHVGAHLAIPRIKLLQKMSDEVDKHSPGYIKGADAGDFISTLTNKVYGENVKQAPVYWVITQATLKHNKLLTLLTNLKITIL